MAEQYYEEVRQTPLDAKPAKIKAWAWTGDKIVQKETTTLERQEDLGLRQRVRRLFSETDEHCGSASRSQTPEDRLDT